MRSGRYPTPAPTPNLHASVLEYVARQVDAHQLAGRSVLEIGSYNVNGSVRHLFTGPYFGVDTRPGPGVDLVIDELQHDYNGGGYEVVVSTETLEHDPFPWLTLQAAYCAIEPAGHLLVTARAFNQQGCFPFHAHLDDFWRFSRLGMERLLAHIGFEVLDCSKDPEYPGVFATARRPRATLSSR